MQTFEKSNEKNCCKAMRIEANRNFNIVFYFLRRMKKDRKGVEGGRCLNHFPTKSVI